MISERAYNRKETSWCKELKAIVAWVNEWGGGGDVFPTLVLRKRMSLFIIITFFEILDR